MTVTCSGDRPDIVLIGAGIMSATLGVLLKEIEPSLDVVMLEALADCAQESSEGWNNAGTGHAANCELNYTPRRPDDSIDISKALEVNTEFDLSRELWAFLVRKGAIPDPRAFIHPCPHMSFVWGQENVAFLRARFEAMSGHHCYRGMEFSEDHTTIGSWAPLVMAGRDPAQAIAATRLVTGTDVDYGALTHLLVDHLSGLSGFEVRYETEVVGLDRDSDGRWLVSSKNIQDRVGSLSAGFVFIGAGGGSLPLLQRSAIPEGEGYGGFPVSGIWLRCDVDAVAQQHHAKVYGKAPSGSPPMSVPHLDTRIVGGRQSLLFGPYAGFSTRFLKHGSVGNLFSSITRENVLPLLDVARDNPALYEYLIGQVLQTPSHQFDALKGFYPTAVEADWTKAVAGQRVQTIRPRPSSGWFKHEGGELEFGTELVSAGDGSLVALLGASPGASTAASIAIEVLRRCFAAQVTDGGWLPRLKEIIPIYGIDLKLDADACRQSRIETALLLRIEHV